MTGREWVDLREALVGVRTPCQSSDAEAWWSDDRATLAIAADACGLCPVLWQCRAYADAAGERWGVWGGQVRKRGGAVEGRAS